jgi:formylglycine-generating enzyme required for sulfatase activity
MHSLPVLPEVTGGQFQAFVTDTGYLTEAEKGDGATGWDIKKKTLFEKNAGYSWKSVGFAQTDEHPVVCVRWDDAKAFYAWLANKSGRAVRLPTEAEWERACRGDTQTRFSFGEDEEDLRIYANVADASFRNATGNTYGIKGDDGYGFTAPVGKFRANAYGLSDMHGNAWELCEDQYRSYKDFTDKKDPISSKKAGEDERRILRGGSWGVNPGYSRAACRGYAPSERDDSIGFRVAFRLD